LSAARETINRLVEHLMSGRDFYTLFMFLAPGVFLLVRHFVPRPAALERLPWQQRAILALSAFVGGTVAAKLPFVGAGEAGWFAPEAWLADGKTITLGLVGAYLGVEVAKLALGIRVKTGDTFALPLALALAVGRWGCFLNGCCYGTPTAVPWAVSFNLDGRLVRCHPTQIYESFFHLALAGLILLAMRLDVLRCQRLKAYLIVYAAFRFLREFIRPEPAVLGGLTFYQWVTLGMIAGLSVQWVIDSRQLRRDVDPATLTAMAKPAV
jgi:phosphatidylglycerol:prolipoprotein diacylglycerol transferase